MRVTGGRLAPRPARLSRIHRLDHRGRRGPTPHASRAAPRARLHLAVARCEEWSPMIVYRLHHGNDRAAHGDRRGPRAAGVGVGVTSGRWRRGPPRLRRDAARADRDRHGRGRPAAGGRNAARDLHGDLPARGRGRPAATARGRGRPAAAAVRGGDDDRPLRGHPPAGAGRDGRGVPGPRHQAWPPGRAQAAHQAERHQDRAVPRRGPGHGALQAREHRDHLRGRRARRLPLHGARVHRGPEPARVDPRAQPRERGSPGRESPRAPEPGRGAHGARGPRPGLRAQARDRASRSQARERHGRRLRPDQGARLRARQDARGRSRPSGHGPGRIRDGRPRADAPGHDHGDAALHVPRAMGRGHDRRAQRSVGRGHHAVRARRRPTPDLTAEQLQPRADRPARPTHAPARAARARTWARSARSSIAASRSARRSASPRRPSCSPRSRPSCPARRRSSSATAGARSRACPRFRKRTKPGSSAGSATSPP
jgi:hypothetical protein